MSPDHARQDATQCSVRRARAERDDEVSKLFLPSKNHECSLESRDEIILISVLKCKVSSRIRIEVRPQVLWGHQKLASAPARANQIAQANSALARHPHQEESRERSRGNCSDQDDAQAQRERT
jgi:hypothetical protein